MNPNLSIHRTCAKSRARPVNSDVWRLNYDPHLLAWKRKRYKARTKVVAFSAAVRCVVEVAWQEN